MRTMASLCLPGLKDVPAPCGIWGWEELALASHVQASAAGRNARASGARQRCAALFRVQ